ncbi:MAG: MotA/TolQ/ExbB proton channel family protein [Kiritimatiellales bacterium]|jgi:biopolymer transport protein ExbB
MKTKMNTTRILLGVFCLAFSSFADQPSADESMNLLSASSGRELNRSIQELTRLREQIATEKLPLAQELTAAEEKLVQLRRSYEQVARRVDSGNLELTTIKAEMKARQDELTYTGNLLDEYARSFESKINISELQYCGESLDAAKKAAENTTLPMAEKFTCQTAFLKVSVDRIFNAIGGMRFPGTGVDMQGTVEEGQFAVIGPAALFRANDGKTAGIVVPQSGSARPLIRPLDGAMQSGLASLVENGEGTVPLDPSRGGALKALVQQKVSLVSIFKKGGPIMWPLLLAAGLAVFTVVERILFLIGQQVKRDPKAMDKFFAAVERGDTEEAVEIGNASEFYVVRTLGYALRHKEKSLANALLYAQEQETKRFRRGIPVLDTIITLAPLLGLLGTVTGMMGSFSLIGGELSSPGAITGGIAEALIATAFGLGIAITSLIPFNYLNTKMEEARLEIECAATQLELLVHPAAETAAHASKG